MLLLLIACGAPTEVERSTPTYATPSITSATVDCSVTDAEWTFRVDADAWTGNGQLFLSADGTYVERHPMYSNGAAYDGTSDTLRLTLATVPDFRDVVLGGSTAFACGDAGVTGVLQINERDGRTVADCRAFGEAPERWDTWEPALACPLLLDD